MDGTCVMKLDFSVSDTSEEIIFKGAAEILKSLRPQWQQDEICYKMLTDGITNKLVRCKLKDADETTAVLIRIYGNKTDLLIDRKAETRNIQMLNKFDLAPSLYATFTNGLAYQFVPGCTLTSESVRDPQIYNLVAKHMAKLHKVHLKTSNVNQANGKTSKESVLWTKVHNFLKLVPEQFSNNQIQKKKKIKPAFPLHHPTRHNVPRSDWSKVARPPYFNKLPILAYRFIQLNLTKQQITQEVQILKQHLCLLDSPVVFCHNDLLLGNVIYTSDETDSNDNKVTFIDFEYADFNYQAFDIGNHFAEFAGVDTVDYSNYPDKKLQYAWLTQYLREFYDTEDIEDKLDVLYVQVNRFALASHLLWGIWALIQAEHSYIDFDFIEYSSLRLSEYFRRKEEFLSLQFESSS